MAVNIYDVAKLSGVSIATVSRVVNGSTKVNLVKQDHPYQVVTKELLSFRNGFIHHDPEKIKAVIQELLEVK